MLSNICYNVSFQVNKTNQLLLSSDVTINIIIDEIYATCSLLQDHHKNGYISAKSTMHEISEENGTEEKLEPQAHCEKYLLDYKSCDEIPEEHFCQDFFNTLDDQGAVI